MIRVVYRVEVRARLIEVEVGLGGVGVVALVAAGLK